MKIPTNNPKIGNGLVQLIKVKNTFDINGLNLIIFSILALNTLSRMEFPISISRTSLFQILSVLGGIFHFYSIFVRNFCKQTVETLISSAVSDQGLRCLSMSYK